MASSVSMRTISPTVTPLPTAYDCVAVHIAGRRTNLVVDLRTAQVYCDPIFLASQEVYLNFHHFVCKIVGGVGGEGIYRN